MNIQNKAEQGAAAAINRYFGFSKVARIKPFRNDRHCKVCDKFLKKGERFGCCNQIDKGICKVCDGHDYTFCREHKYHNEN